MSSAVEPRDAAESILAHRERALALHRSCLIVDGHADTLDRILTEGHSFLEPSPDFQIDWPRLQASQVNAQVFSLWTPPEYQGERSMHRALKMIGAFLEMQRECPQLRQIQSVADLDASRPGFLFSFEGADPLVDDLTMLEVFYRLGVRMIGLTWNGRNAFADGLRVGPRPSGLTELGRELVERMGELGIVLDLAHIAEPGFWDALECSAGPVVATHANVHALHAHARNLRDDQIRAIAQRGGLVGITYVPGFLAREGADLSDVLDHIDYVVQLVGDDHVGLGSDFDGITTPPTRLSDVGQLPNLTAGMLARGYTEARVAKILGGNWQRLFAAVWK
jgi:membrane dipeptidase